MQHDPIERRVQPTQGPSPRVSELMALVQDTRRYLESVREVVGGDSLAEERSPAPLIERMSRCLDQLGQETGGAPSVEDDRPNA